MDGLTIVGILCGALIAALVFTLIAVEGKRRLESDSKKRWRDWAEKYERERDQARDTYRQAWTENFGLRREAEDKLAKILEIIDPLEEE